MVELADGSAPALSLATLLGHRALPQVAVQRLGFGDVRDRYQVGATGVSHQSLDESVLMGFTRVAAVGSEAVRALQRQGFVAGDEPAPRRPSGRRQPATQAARHPL
jgi:hypothetical protein